MCTEQEDTKWIASIETSRIGYTYVRLYEGAPSWVRDRIINRFGKGTVFLRPVPSEAKAACDEPGRAVSRHKENQTAGFG